MTPSPLFVRESPWRVARGAVPVHRQPDAATERISELLYGEGFRIERRDGDWAWGHCDHDGYAGWLPAAALAPPEPKATHRVAALRALLYPAPDLRAPPADAVSLGARVAVVGPAVDGFVPLDDGRWIAAVALAALDVLAPDPAATALRFLGVPYLWGGRSSLGVDCSGLVQVALAAAGIAVPRDSGPQSRSDAAGRLIAGPTDDDPAMLGLRRNDLVFFPGHVGLMADAEMLVHANATRMAVSLDPLAEVVARVRAASGRGIVAARRPALP